MVGMKKAVSEVLASLKKLGSRQTRESMVRFGIHTPKAFGIPMAAMQRLAKQIGRDHQLAGELWETGWYEARIVAAYIEEPERATAAQMDRWCKEFDNWGICDTVCFQLFDKTPYAYRKVRQWATRKPEFEKRAAFALLACLALRDRSAGDQPFLECLPLIEAAAEDDRNFVKKGVSWALRLIGRRNRELHTAALTLAKRLAASSSPSARWIGKDAVKELTGAVVTRRLSRLAPAPGSM